MIKENFALNIYIKKEEKSKMNSLIFYLKSLVSCLLLPVGLVDFFSEPMASCAYTQLWSASVSLLYPLWTVWSWPDIFTCVSHVILTSALDLDIFAHYYRKGDWGTERSVMFPRSHSKWQTRDSSARNFAFQIHPLPILLTLGKGIQLLGNELESPWAVAITDRTIADLRSRTVM